MKLGNGKEVDVFYVPSSHSTRIEKLEDGLYVFYVNVSGIVPNKQLEYMKTYIKNLENLNGDKIVS